MTDLIDRKALRTALQSGVDETWFNHVIAPVIDAAPTVSCERCEYGAKREFLNRCDACYCGSNFKEATHA